MFSVVILAANTYCGCALSLRSRVNDSKNHRDVAISTESLQIPGNQYKPTSGNELWMEMKCMYWARLSTGDVIYSLIEICFPSWRVEFATWRVVLCAVIYCYGLFWSHKIHKLRWYVLGEYFSAFIKPDYDLMFLFLLMLHMFITYETRAQVIRLWLSVGITFNDKKKKNMA